MRQETFQEKLYHNMLPPDIESNAHVTFGYQDNLRIIQKHLQTFYDHRADWSQCVDAYFRSAVYQDFAIVQRDVKIYQLLRQNSSMQ